MTTETLDSLRTALSDRYRIERELGGRGMATVYLAHLYTHHVLGSRPKVRQE